MKTTGTQKSKLSFDQSSAVTRYMRLNGGRTWGDMRRAVMAVRNGWNGGRYSGYVA